MGRQAYIARFFAAAGFCLALLLGHSCSRTQQTALSIDKNSPLLTQLSANEFVVKDSLPGTIRDISVNLDAAFITFQQPVSIAGDFSSDNNTIVLFESDAEIGGNLTAHGVAAGLPNSARTIKVGGNLIVRDGVGAQSITVGGDLTSDGPVYTLDIAPEHKTPPPFIEVVGNLSVGQWLRTSGHLKALGNITVSEWISVGEHVATPLDIYCAEISVGAYSESLDPSRHYISCRRLLAGKVSKGVLLESPD